MPSRGKRLRWVAFACAAIFLPSVSAAQLPAVRAVDLTASDGVALKASYFAAAKPGPGVLLLHQGNRDRTAWSGLAGRLAAAGIHALTVDMRGFGESGGTPHDQLPPREEYRIRQEV
jgi:predicted alpha/beta hydrolase